MRELSCEFAQTLHVKLTLGAALKENVRNYRKAAWLVVGISNTPASPPLFRPGCRYDFNISDLGLYLTSTHFCQVTFLVIQRNSLF
jgi:hypothetical protein